MNINDRLDILKSHCFGKDLEDHVKAIREHIEEQDAIKTELYEACKRAVRFINNGMEFGYVSMPEKPDSAIDTLPKLKVIIEKIEADK